MKNILIILFLIVSNNLFAQKYLQLIPEIAPDSASCNGKVKAIFHGGTAPYQITWWDNHWQPSTGVTAEDLCDNNQYTVSFVDYECSYLESLVKLREDTTLQIYLDTVIIVMPSAVGMCDGELHFQFTNVNGTHVKKFGDNGGSMTVAGYSFTGLCEDIYHYSIYKSGSEEYKVSVDNRIDPPSPCYDFAVSISETPPANSTVCNGQLQSNPTGGSGDPFIYQFIAQTGGGGSTILNANQYQNFINGVCQGPYLIDTYNELNIMWKRNTVFVFANSQNDSTWNMPDSLLPSTDTILLQALVNCSPDYSQGIDTAFISSINSIGNNQYEFGVTIIQGTDTITAYGNAITDTSLNYFIDITLFCEDSTRSIDPFLGKRNLIYHGVQLQSTQSLNENNFFTSFKIYPNPSENIFQIDFETKESSMLNFELTDITGKLIHSVQLSFSIGKNHLNLDLDQFASGLYLLNIRSEKGLLQNNKLIKN